MATTSSAGRNETTVREFVECINEARYDELDEYMTADMTFHPTSAANDRDLSGVEAQREWFETTRRAFPDEHYELEQVLSDDEFVAVRATITGTHEGEYMGLDPTGKRFEEAMFVLMRMDDGKIAEAWALADIYGTAMQFGLVPPIEELFAGESTVQGA